MYITPVSAMVGALVLESAGAVKIKWETVRTGGFPDRYDLNILHFTVMWNIIMRYN